MSDIIGDSYSFGLFAPVPATGEAKRDRAVEKNTERVRESVGGDALVERVTTALRQRERFTADDVAHLLDEMGVAHDLDTRRKLTSVIVNAGRNKWWKGAGYVTSTDPRRNARPVTAWERVA